jgi:hypothetical protein
MTNLHPWVTTKLQPPIDSSVLFRLPNQSNEVIRLDKDGFHYRGQFIEDAGEAHRLLVEFLRQGTAHAKAEQPVGAAMTDLSPRQYLIKELNEKLIDAFQSDFEHGVKALNIAAKEEFNQKYPALIDVLDWIALLTYEEFPND